MRNDGLKTLALESNGEPPWLRDGLSFDDADRRPKVGLSPSATFSMPGEGSGLVDRLQRPAFSLSSPGSKRKVYPGPPGETPSMPSKPADPGPTPRPIPASRDASKRICCRLTSALFGSFPAAARRAARVGVSVGVGKRPSSLSARGVDGRSRAKKGGCARAMGVPRSQDGAEGVLERSWNRESRLSKSTASSSSSSEYAAPGGLMRTGCCEGD